VEGIVSVVPCPAGQFNPNRGQSSSGACQYCTTGSYCPLGSSEALTCTTGAACPYGSVSNFATPCPAGYWLEDTGASSTGSCQSCPEYYYCPERTTYPVKCPPGHFCPAGSTSGTTYECPAGTYGGLDSLRETGECTTCPLGHYCPAASVFPTQCGPGTFQPDEGATADSDCDACPATTVCPFYGLRHSATAIYCGHGQACPAGTKWQHENPCPAGTYSDDRTITDTSSCVTCPAKYACPQREGLHVGTLGTNTLTNPKVACAVGHYCPAGTASTTANPCPAGTHSPATDNYEVGQCITCPPGQYCSGGLALPDGDCAPGHYCPTEASTDT